MTMPPAGSEQIAAWAHARGLPYQVMPTEGWFRAWEPFWVLVSPIRYFNTVRAQTGASQVVLVEPWYADDGLTPSRRSLMAFLSHPGLRYRAAARLGAGPLTRVRFLGEAPPREQSTGDPDWDDRAVTFAASPLEAVRAFTPSLRKLLLGWSFEGHVEVRPGGLMFHLASAEPHPHDYERVLNWMPAVLEKSLKERP